LRAKVYVFLKPGVLDVQGKAIEGALHGLGFSDAANVRVGKTIELDVKGDADAARAQATRMAEQLLANTVIESYRVEVG
jgi:phosphoribosylformylglycinamidine synthase PurS subunit